MKVYQNGKLNIIQTIKANMPRPALTRKYKKEDKERAARSRRDACFTRLSYK